MDGEQAAIPGATDAVDEQLIALLVPPPRPRRQVVVAVAAAAALVVGIVALSAAGAVVPRLDVWIDRWSTHGDSLTVGFRVRNQGSFDARIRSLDARSPGLEGMRMRVTRARTVRGHTEIAVTVRFDRIDCDQVARRAGPDDVRLRVTNAFGVTFTHSYPVQYRSDGWAQDVTEYACSGGRG